MNISVTIMVPGAVGFSRVDVPAGICSVVFPEAKGKLARCPSEPGTCESEAEGGCETCQCTRWVCVSVVVRRAVFAVKRRVIVDKDEFGSPFSNFVCLVFALTQFFRPGT